MTHPRPKANVEVMNSGPVLTVFLIDDEPEVLKAYEYHCKQRGFLVESFLKPKDFLDRYTGSQKLGPHVIVSDISMPEVSGLALIENVLGINPDAILIFLTGHREVSLAVEAMKKGAFDYLNKSTNYDEFIVRLKRAFGVLQGRQETLLLESQAFQLNTLFGVQGQSAVVRELFSKLRKVVELQTPVLLAGPPGVGKLEMARALHNRGKNSAGEFVVHTFGVGSPEKFEQSARAMFERAEGGSLLLHEIEKMSPSEQSLLSQLKSEFAGRNIRYLSTSSVSLEVLAQNNFNLILLHSLAVVPVEIPALVHRKEDVPVLANDYLRKAAQSWGRKTRRFSRDALKILKNHTWPGNLKELESTVERAVILCDGFEILPDHIQISSVDLQDPFAWLEQLHRLPTLKEFEVVFIKEALKRSQGHKERAARMLGIGRKTLYRKEQEIFNGGKGV